MATDPMAQDVIRCDLCTDKHVPSPVDVLCNTCNIKLCNECLVKHIYSKLSIKHDIVGFIFKTIDTPSVSCQLHSNLKCDLQCRTCNSPVCAKCLLSDSHRNHDFIEIKESFDLQKQAIKQDTEELENLIVPVYENIKSELKTEASKLLEGYDVMNQSILQQGKDWHDEVDIIIKENLTKAEQMKKDDVDMLGKLQSYMDDQLSKVRQSIEENKNLMKSNAGTEIMNYKSQNDEFRRIPPSFDLFPPTFVPIKIPGEELNQMFGELKPSTKIEKESYTIQSSQELSLPSNKQFLNKMIVNNITTVRFADRVCSVPNTDQCIVRAYGIMKRLDSNGSEYETVQTQSGHHYNINLTATREGNLVYSDHDDGSINIVQQEKTDAIIRLRGWKPLAVCSTSSDDLLISMWTDDRIQSKVVRYAGSSVTQEIQFDDHAKPLYSRPHFIDENKNLQVCVSDSNTKIVLVTDKSGKLMFRYNGNISSKKYESFNPYGLATDSMCHILVADLDNKCVHIIDHEGKFVRFIEICDLLYPQGLSISCDNMLYIADCSSQVKVIKYLQ